MLATTDETEPAPPTGPILVFGGTGFLGRRVVRHLLARGYSVRVASRHPERGTALFGTSARLTSVGADIADDSSIVTALKGCWGVVNAVSLYVESGGDTFHSIHVKAAGQLARQAREHGLRRLLQVSGIGSTPLSSSTYIRSRGLGELEARKAFPDATIVRPAVMFGYDDGFLVPLTDLLHRTPILPMFGYGRTKLQPAHVEDVGEAMARIIGMPHPSPTYELGGPEVLTYRQLLEKLKTHLGIKTMLLPMPFFAWRILATAAEFLPRPPITRNQVELMRKDNVAWSEPGFEAIEIAPHSIDGVIGEILGPRC